MRRTALRQREGERQPAAGGPRGCAARSASPRAAPVAQAIGRASDRAGEGKAVSVATGGSANEPA
jgi:hypothetical protein